jgi:DNA-binding transcriptional LysR family regulator
MRNPFEYAHRSCKFALVDWGDYRYFLALSKVGSLSGAARLMRVDQSTVGRRLAALEGHVGARLFDRTPDGYVLTAVGESVRADVEQLQEGFLAVERRLAGEDVRLAGTVRLAITEVFANAFLIPHLRELRLLHPGLSLDLVTGNAPIDLARREADLAVRLGPAPTQPNLVVRQIGLAEFALYGATEYLERRGRPRPRDGLSGHDVIGYHGDLSSTPMARFVHARAQRATVVLRVNSVASAFEAVAAGYGISALPCVLGARGLQRVGSVGGATPIRTVVHQDLMRNGRIRAVLGFLADVIRRESRSLRG